MNINQAGIDLIKRFEGLKLEAYRCPAGVWTIGYGTTGERVQRGLKIGKAQAEAWLKDDLEKFGQGVAQLIGDAPTTDNQFSAMVSLAYNIGLGNFKSSSVLRCHKEGAYAVAASSFKLWNKAAGKVLPGLVARRAAEAALYSTP